MDAVVIVAAAFVAGIINSIAGGGTLLSFPALIWIGRDPILANATSTIALWPGAVGSLWGYRREVATPGSRRYARWLLVPSLVGGIVGAVLLLRTDSRLFDALVPWLLLGATLLVAANEPIAAAVNRRTGRARGRAFWWSAVAFQFLVGIYGGYFGAGIGILMLAALGLLGLTDIHQMNGLKNFLGLSINGVAAAYFALSGAVIWSDALLMAGAAVLGGITGATLARRVGRRAVRRAVVVIGMAMAVSLFVRRL